MSLTTRILSIIAPLAVLLGGAGFRTVSAVTAVAGTVGVLKIEGMPALSVTLRNHDNGHTSLQWRAGQDGAMVAVTGLIERLAGAASTMAA